jgi:probable selenium-dependent hydroxylase accessory protein YqeC
VRGTTRAAALDLLDQLAARRGLVCVVGAGGKKTTLYRLVEAHLAAGSSRVGLTCTVAMAPPPRSIGKPLIAEAANLADELARRRHERPVLVYAQPSSKPGRIGGVPPAVLAGLHADGGFDVTLIKADGARMRWIKAPEEEEPVLPPDAATVLPLVSAKIFGQPLSEAVAHRPERVAAVTGAEPGELLTPEHVARLLTSEHGALRGVGRATVVPIINMVDDQAKRAAARGAARAALARSDRLARVVLARMVAADPVIEVVAR